MRSAQIFRDALDLGPEQYPERWGRPYAEAIARVAAEPFLQDLMITAIPVHEAASTITRG